jgi:diguanylate cyclase (GGDEF)-like protein
MFTKNLSNLFLKFKNLSEDKLLTYLFGFGATIVLLIWLLNVQVGLITHFDYYDLLFQAVVLITSSIGLTQKTKYKKYFLMAPYFSISWHMHASWFLALFTYKDGYYIIALLSAFFPLIYLTGHYFFKNNGTKIALLNFSVMALISFTSLIHIQNPKEIQLILTNVMAQPVYIISLHFIIMMRKKTHQSELIQQELKEKLERDTLTGIYNRLYLNNIFSQDQYNLENKNFEKIGMMMIDIDYFKRINDTLGHDNGDLVLQQVATKIKSITRDTDHFVRWGGEEFVMFINQATPEALNILAQRVLNVVTQISPGKSLPNVTVSIGMSMRHNDESAKDILNSADQALYKSKQNGRNQASFYKKD